MKVCSVCQRCYEDSAASCTEENHPPLSESHAGSPEIVAGYSLDFLLESKGKSRLYRARHIDSGQSCLIKILAADEKNKQQFLRETQIAAGIVQPNIAAVYESGELETGEVFFVAEDAGGQTLRQLLNDVGVPSLITTIQVIRQTAEALHEIHLKGLTHRAVSPENIVLTTDAQQRSLAKIQNFDFGAINEKFIAAGRFLSQPHLNSLKYFAPEQCAGETASVQSDVYALGIVFYEMLSGAPPFDGANAAELTEKHKNQPPPEIKINNFNLRMLLTHTLTEALRKPPRLRHASANAFARQIRHIEQLATHISTPPPVVTVSPPLPAPKFANVIPANPVDAAPVKTPGEFSKESFQTEISAESLKKKTEPRAETENRSNSDEIKIESLENKLEIELIPAAKDANEPVKCEEEPDDPVIEFKENYDLASDLKAESEFITISEFENPSTEFPEMPETVEFSDGETNVENFVEEEIFAAPVEFETQKIEFVHDEPNESEIVAHEPAEFTNVSAEREEIPHVSPNRKPTLIEWQQDEDDIPSEADVLEAQLREQLAEYAEPPKTEQIAVEKFYFAKESLPEDVFLPEEELSPVEDYSLLRDEVELLPASFENAKKTEAFERENAVFFSSESWIAAPFPLYNRSLVIGGGFAALLILFLVGVAFVSGGALWATEAKPETVLTVSEQKPAALTESPGETLPAQENLEAALPEEYSEPAAADENYLIPLRSAGEHTPESTEEPPVLAAQTDVQNTEQETPAVVSNTEQTTLQQPEQQQQEQPAAQPPPAAAVAEEKPRTLPKEEKTPIAYTVVIYADNGTIKSKVEPQKKSAAKDQDTNSNVNKALSRPRIVQTSEP
jgi:serine/threonine protein kinase